MISVDEINVGVAGRSEENGGARGVASGGVSRWIVFPQVGFNFHDAGDQTVIADQ